MSTFQWLSRSNIALVGHTCNSSGSGSISECFCGSYKTDTMKMETYSLSAGQSMLHDSTDPQDHHLSDPKDILARQRCLINSKFDPDILHCGIIWDSPPTCKSKMFSSGRSNIFQVVYSADSALLQQICLQVKKLLVYKSQKQISKWKEQDNGGTYQWTKAEVWFAYTQVGMTLTLKNDTCHEIAVQKNIPQTRRKRKASLGRNWIAKLTALLISHRYQ